MQVSKCQFIQNSAPFNGGGAIQGDEGWLIAKECLFMENTGSGSGAVTMNNSRGFVAVNSVFSANTAGDGMQAHLGAGALRLWSLHNANYRIYGCTLKNNTNTRGIEGAVSLSTSASSGSIFSNSIIYFCFYFSV
jgi:predicted outer membrane repeat protein